MSELIGRTLLGRYHVQELIGRGGMAEVYKVWDQLRAVHLAVKVLHDELAIDRVFIRRFRREAQTLEKLQHPNIVRFYGLERENGQVFMLLDYVDGKSLKRLIFEHGAPMPLGDVLNMMRSICAALHFAHQIGIVHADIKPGNILINQRGDIFVTDFGIARMTEAVTMTLVGAGTPAYMSPEQIKGQPPSPLSDQYALGVVLYEMVTGGERPFTGELSTKSGTISEKIRWEHLNLNPPNPQRWNPQLPDDVSHHILKSLHKEASKRFSSVMVFRQELEHTILPYLEGQGQIEKVQDVDGLDQDEARHYQEMEKITGEIEHLRIQTKAAVEASDWERMVGLSTEIRQRENLLSASQADIDRIAQVRELRDAAEGLFQQNAMDQVIDIIPKLESLRDEGVRVATRLQGEIDRLHEEEQRVAGEFQRLQDEIGTAIDNERWEKAEDLLVQLSALGNDRQDIIPSIQDQISQAKHADQQRAVEAADIQDKFKAALDVEDFTAAENLLTMLEAYGPPVSDSVARMREQIESLRGIVTARAEKIDILEGVLESAIAGGLWEEAEQLLVQLGELGEEGRVRQAALEARLAQAMEEAQLRSAEIDRLQDEIRRALAEDDIDRAEDFLSFFRDYGTVTDEISAKIQAEIVKFRDQIQQWSENIEQIEADLPAILDNKDWEKASAIVVRLSNYGKKGRDASERWNEVIQSKKDDEDQERIEIERLKNTYEEAIADEDLRRAEEIFVQLSESDQINEAEIDALYKSLVAAQEAIIEQKELFDEKAPHIADDEEVHVKTEEPLVSAGEDPVTPLKPEFEKSEEHPDIAFRKIRWPALIAVAVIFIVAVGILYLMGGRKEADLAALLDASNMPSAGTNTPTSDVTYTSESTSEPILTPSLSLAATLTSTQTETTLPTQTPFPTLYTGATQVSSSDGMVQIYIPAGAFLMGSVTGSGSDELPRHEVLIDAYWIDKMEVTTTMFAQFLNDAGNQIEGSGAWLDDVDGDVHVLENNGIWQPEDGYENHPVNEVSWFGANAYCEWAGRQLPTEAEWEKATRGGVAGKKHPWEAQHHEGDCSWKGANVYKCGETSVPVGSFAPNGYGLQDMGGNVREWVADWYAEDYYQYTPEKNPNGPEEGTHRVVRGGSWERHTEYAQSSTRSSDWPYVTWHDIGFRCADDVFDASDEITDKEQSSTHSSTESQSPQVLLLYTLEGHTGSVTSVVWSPDNRFVASGSMDHTVRIWDAQSGDEVLLFDDHTGNINDIAWSLDGKYLASTSKDRKVKVWNSLTGKQNWEHYEIAGSGIFPSASWSPDGDFLAVATGCGSLFYYASSGNLYGMLDQYCGHNTAHVAWSPDSQYLAMAGDQRTRILDFQAWEQVKMLDGTIAVFSPDGKLLALGGSTPLSIYDVESWGLIQSMTAWNSETLAWSPDSRFLASGSADARVRIFDVQNGAMVHLIEVNAGTVNSMDWSSDGNYLLLGNGDGSVQIWEIPGESASSEQDSGIQYGQTLFDVDFEDQDTSAWDFTPTTGIWGITEDSVGNHVLRAISDTQVTNSTAVINRSDWENVSLRFRFYVIDSPGSSDEGETLGVRIPQWGDCSFLVGLGRIWQILGAEGTECPWRPLGDSGKRGNIERLQWYQVRIDRFGQAIQVYLNDELLMDAEIKNRELVDSSGGIQFYVSQGAVIYLDDVDVVEILSVEE